jgi:hypothetical protein
MTFLTPYGALVVLATLLPLAAYVFARGRSELARRRLGLPARARTAEIRPLLAAIGIALLGLAAAQPALTRTSHPRVRSDAQAVFVLDTSRSMAAAATPNSPTRLDRATAAAVRLRNAIPDVPSGVLTLTDRVLPDLLPVPDVAGFDGVVERAVAIESPPPHATAPRATSYDALGQIATGGSFAPSVKRRIVVLLTDGESNPVQTSDVTRELAGYRFLAIRFWGSKESVFDGDGKVEAAYRPDPSGATTLRDLAASLDGRSFDESRVAAAAKYLRAIAGTGPTMRSAGTDLRRVPLTPYLALLGLLALVAGLAPSHLVARRVRLRRQ